MDACIIERGITIQIIFYCKHYFKQYIFNSPSQVIEKLSVPIIIGYKVGSRGCNLRSSCNIECTMVLQLVHGNQVSST